MVYCFRVYRLKKYLKVFVNQDGVVDMTYSYDITFHRENGLTRLHSQHCFI